MKKGLFEIIIPESYKENKKIDKQKHKWEKIYSEKSM